MNITNAQQRIYTAGMLSPESTMYNITFAIKVDKLNPSKLEKAISGIDGVTRASVSFIAGKMIVEADEKDMDAVIAAIPAVAKKTIPDCTVII